MIKRVMDAEDGWLLSWEEMNISDHSQALCLMVADLYVAVKFQITAKPSAWWWQIYMLLPKASTQSQEI